VDYRLHEFRVDGRDIDPALGFLPPRAYTDSEFVLEPLEAPAWGRMRKPGALDPVNLSDGSGGPEATLERGWLPLCSSHGEFDMFVMDLEDAKLPLTSILDNKGLDLDGYAEATDAMRALREMLMEELGYGEEGEEEGEEGEGGAGGRPGRGLGPLDWGSLFGGEAAAYAEAQYRYVEAVVLGDVDTASLWAVVRKWFPPRGDVFAVSFSHEEMMGLYCFKAIEPDRDGIRDIIPVFTDAADAERFAENVQAYMPFPAEVIAMEAPSAVDIATELNAHLHLERPGSLLLPPQKAVLATDLEVAAQLAKETYSVLEEHLPAWDSPLSELPRAKGLTLPGSEGKDRVTVFNLEDYDSQSTLSAMGLDLEALGLERPTPRGDDDPSGSDAEADEPPPGGVVGWGEWAVVPDPAPDAEAADPAPSVAKGSGPPGPLSEVEVDAIIDIDIDDDDDDDDDDEPYGIDAMGMDENDLYMVHFEEGAVKVWGQPDDRLTSSRSGSATPSGNGITEDPRGSPGARWDKSLPITKSVLPRVSEGAEGGRDGGGSGTAGRGAGQDADARAPELHPSIEPMLRQVDDWVGRVSLQDLLEKGADARKDVGFQEKFRQRVDSMASQVPRLRERPVWPPTKGRARRMWELQNPGRAAALGAAEEAGEGAAGAGEESPDAERGVADLPPLARQAAMERLEEVRRVEELLGDQLAAMLVTSDGSGIYVAATEGGADVPRAPTVSCGSGIPRDVVVAQGIVYVGPKGAWEDMFSDDDSDDDSDFV